MNNNLKILLGALVGAGAGYFVGQVIVDIIALKENPDWEKDFEYEDLDEDPGNDDETNLEDGEPELMNKNALKTKRVKNYTQYFKNQNRPDLAALAAKYNGEEESVYETPEVVEGVLTEEIEYSVEDEAKQTDPSIISMSEFANAGDEYECLTLNYYDDDVVTDENDEPISRPEQILGDEALVSFGELSEDQDVVYVRNEKKKAMYEVVRTNKEYAAPKSRRGKLKIDYDTEETIDDND